jgi:type I restriction enzyme S subunit
MSPEIKDTKTGEIPKEWEVLSLEEVTVDLIGGGTPSTSQPEYWDGDIPWMTSANLIERVVHHGMRNITEKGLRNSATNIVPKGSLLISTRVGIGKVGIAEIDVAISQDLTGLVPDKDKADVEYLYWAILNKSSQLSGLSQGSTVKGLTREYVRNLKLPLPPLAEQKKIAEILSTLDQAIGKVDEAIEKTQKLKKGLMQELLTKGIGHKEFKETEVGRIPKEWKITKLGEMSELERGKFAFRPRNDPKFYGGEFPFIQTGDISEANGMIKKYYQTLNEYGFKISKLFKKGTIVISIAGNIGDVGILDFDSCFPDSIVGIRGDSEKANNLFLMYLLQKFKRELDSIAPRSTQKNINLGILEAFKLPLPPLSEQEKIAEILSSADERLELLRKRKERLERTKKGLMNDLLTGRKRVKLN